MSDAPRAAARLPRPAVLFGIVSLVNDFASEMVYPLIPAFVTTVLGAGAASLGVLDGAADFAATFVKLRAGRRADRPAARGPLIVVGYLTAVIVRPVVALTGAAWQVIGLRVADRIGKGVRTPPRDALIADATPPALRGRAFGLQRGLDHLGAVIGPVAAWYLLAHHAAGLREVIAASAVPGIVVAALVVWAVRDAGAAPGGAEPAAAPRRAPDGTTPAPERTPVPPALLAVAAFYLFRMPETLFILRSQETGVSVALVLLLWAALHVVRSGTSFIGGAWADRFGPARTMWLGWVAYAGVAAGFAATSSALASWVCFLVYGVVAGLTESPERALVARLAGPRTGTGFGVYHALTGFAALAGSVALGVTYQWVGGPAAFAASAAGAVALALVWPLVRRET